MARFRFKMENILQVKYKLEEQAKAEYGLEIARLREEEEKEEKLRQKRENEVRILKLSLEDVIDMMEVRRLRRGVEIIDDMISEQKKIIKKQQECVDLAREKLDDAMKERKTYEKLKEKAFEEFKKEVNAAEQKEIDELVSFRFGSNKNESEG